MEQKTKVGIKFRDLAPVRLCICGTLLLVIGVISALKGNNAAMLWIYEHITHPWHLFMSRVCSVFPFSVAELIYAVAVIFAVVYIIYSIYCIVKREHKWKQVYITILTVAMLALVFWSALCVFWTPCYYAPRFAETSGVSDEPVSAQELAAVTEYFASIANEYSERVPRDEAGVLSVERADIIDRAAEVFEGAADVFPCLEGAPLRPKGIVCSKIMSYMNFTGFFFPATGEANLNMDSPAYMLASTAEHEIAHQRGVAQEQDCNFVAVFACTESAYDEYIYSGAMLAYVYLGNALHSADYDAWVEIYGTLSDSVRADFAQNNAYWAPFQESTVQKASSAVYDNFLKSNGQELGRKSYGACVDLLVNYYYPIISA